MLARGQLASKVTVSFETCRTSVASRAPLYRPSRLTFLHRHGKFAFSKGGLFDGKRGCYGGAGGIFDGKRGCYGGTGGLFDGKRGCYRCKRGVVDGRWCCYGGKQWEV